MMMLVASSRQSCSGRPSLVAVCPHSRQSPAIAGR
jgi:hypothetical protein